MPDAIPGGISLENTKRGDYLLVWHPGVKPRVWSSYTGGLTHILALTISSE